ATASCRLMKAEASLRTPKGRAISGCFSPHPRPLSHLGTAGENCGLAKGSTLSRFHSAAQLPQGKSARTYWTKRIGG
ncbi:MAG: hypothetical protein ACUVQH_12115, partial [Thermogutta sp.]